MKQRIIFLIDDDEDDREIFNLALSNNNNNCVCVSVESGIEAINKLIIEPGFHPDFIFLDLNMPQMSGFECLQELKKIKRLTEVPIIIYSTSSSIKDMDTTKELGATHYLSKPYDFVAFSKKLATFLSNPINSFNLNT